MTEMTGFLFHKLFCLLFHFFLLKIQSSVIKWSGNGYLRMLGEISNGISIIYQFYEARCDCVCFTGMWSKCPTGTSLLG